MQSSAPPICPKPHDGPAFTRKEIQRDTSIPARKKITTACRGCRAKRTKCDGGSPTCSNCKNLRTECIYDNLDLRRKRAWKGQVDDLQRRNKELEDTISLLKCNLSAEAKEHVRQLRNNQLCSSLYKDAGALESNIIPGDDDRDRELQEMPSPRDSNRSCPESLRGQSGNTQRSGWDTSLLDIDWRTGVSSNFLPPQEVTLQATSFFFSYADSYFYIMPWEACADLIGSIYNQSTISSKSNLCLVCAIAAVGGKYYTDVISDSVCQGYFELTHSLFQDTIEHDPLAAMRASICLSVYLVLDKMASTRIMLATGFNIARSSMSRWLRNASDVDRVEWTRVFRTLAFTECWLASTLGYASDLRSEEINLFENVAASESTLAPDGAINRRLIQSQIYKIAQISAQVHNQLLPERLLSEHELGQLSTKLDLWLEQLPESISLSGACSAHEVPFIRPILLMHMVNISTRVTLYGRIIKVSLDQQENPSNLSVAHRVFRLPEYVSDKYTSFAKQLARMIWLLKDGQKIRKCCWITIYASFHAVLGLLLRVTQHLTLGPFCDVALDDLASAYACVQTLETCSERDIAAIRLLRRVAPLYQSLKQIADNPASGEQIGTNTDADSSTNVSQLTDIASQLAAAITMHFQESWI